MTKPLHNQRIVFHDCPDNLFVRLHARAVTELTGETSAEDFLPLAISVEDRIIYTSWNGGLAKTEGTVEIPKSLLIGVQTSSSTATIQVLPSIPRCKHVHVEPRNAADWELLQSYAKALESGGLLKQISVVYLNQRLRLKIERDHIEILVKEIRATEANSNPLQVGANEDCYALLVQDTEVIIAPKPRNQGEAVDWSIPQRLIPCQDDWNEAMLHFHTLMQLSPLRVPPFCVLVSETIWNRTYEWAALRVHDAPKTRQQLVRVIPHSSIPSGQAALHPLIRLDLGLDLYWNSVQLRPTSVPEDTPLDSIMLFPVMCNKNRLLPEFRRPDRRDDKGLLPTFGPALAIESGHVCVPLNSVVPLSCFVSATAQIEPADRAGFRYIRLGYKTTGQEDAVSGLQNSMIVLDQDFRSGLMELCDAKWQNGKKEVVQKSELDGLVNALSRPVVSSTAWTSGILSDLQRNTRRMVMLCGPAGCGKTYSSLLLCAMVRLQQHKAALYLDCKLLQESTASLVEILSELDSIFLQAMNAQECVVVLDDLDRIAPNLLGGDENDSSDRVESANPIAISQSKVIADRLLQLIEATSPHGVSIISTCSNMESTNTTLRLAAPICEMQVDVPLLSERDRLSVLGQILTRWGPDTASSDYGTIGKRTEGFRPRDLEKIASRAHHLLRSEANEVSLGDALEEVLNIYTPISHLSLSQSKKVVSPTWDNIGGLFNVKAQLETTVLHPVKYKLIYEQASMSLPRGVLLYGPPGCGKSVLVPALAQACKFPLVSCKGPEILDKYIGASEAKIRELFKRAADMAPSILFLDELDALAPRRGSDHTGVTDRVVNQLLTFLDGVEDSSHSTVYVIGATSRPDKVDSALLRPGRLEQHLYVGPPSTQDELSDLFSTIAKKWNLSANCKDSVSSKAKVHAMLQLVSGIQHFSPADLKAALDTAHVNALHRFLKSAKPEDIAKVEISKDDLTTALGKSRPSLNADDAGELETIYREFQGGTASLQGGTNETKLMTTLK